ncbi:mucin-2-like [Ambystoma mexicanum]|uniref:mucin-2-like n=1 Tax=Ambystoma mexicanum TaxID=8296 RepID=UPI0037E7C3BD
MGPYPKGRVAASNTVEPRQPNHTEVEFPVVHTPLSYAENNIALRPFTRPLLSILLCQMADPLRCYRFPISLWARGEGVVIVRDYSHDIISIYSLSLEILRQENDQRETTAVHQPQEAAAETPLLKPLAKSPSPATASQLPEPVPTGQTLLNTLPPKSLPVPTELLQLTTPTRMPPMCTMLTSMERPSPIPPPLSTVRMTKAPRPTADQSLPTAHQSSLVTVVPLLKKAMSTTVTLAKEVPPLSTESASTQPVKVSSLAKAPSKPQTINREMSMKRDQTCSPPLSRVHTCEATAPRRSLATVPMETVLQPTSPTPTIVLQLEKKPSTTDLPTIQKVEERPNSPLPISPMPPTTSPSTVLPKLANGAPKEDASASSTLREFFNRLLSKKRSRHQKSSLKYQLDAGASTSGIHLPGRNPAIPDVADAPQNEKGCVADDETDDAVTREASTSKARERRRRGWCKLRPLSRCFCCGRG